MSKLVIIESPYAGDVVNNIYYALECVKDSLKKGESPFAPHLFYTDVLNDTDPEERQQGIQCGLNWAKLADLTAVYTDRGVSTGMQLGISHAQENGRSVEYRSLYQRV